MSKNKLKKALLAAVAGTTLFGALGCKTHYSELIYLEDPDPPVYKDMVVNDERYEIRYNLEDLVNTHSDIKVGVAESNYKYQTNKKVKITPGCCISFRIEKYGPPSMDINQVARDVAAVYEGNKAKIEELKGKVINQLGEKRAHFGDQTEVYERDYVLCALRLHNPKEEVIEEFTKTEIIYENRKARNVKLKIIPDGLFKAPYTIAREGKGIFEFNLASDLALSKDSLEQKLRLFKFVSEIKQEFREYILSKLSQRIKEAEYQIIIATDEISESPRISIKNGSISGFIKVYEMPVRVVNSILEDFINEKINSKIKEATIKLEDIDSHMPIEYASMKVKSNAPEKRRLAQEYFEGGLLNLVTSKIDDYAIGEDIKKFDETGVIRLKVYVPNSINTETTHKNYHFLEQNFKFEEDKLSKTVFMAELGTKMRVKIVDK